MVLMFWSWFLVEIKYWAVLNDIFLIEQRNFRIKTIPSFMHHLSKISLFLLSITWVATRIYRIKVFSSQTHTTHWCDGTRIVGRFSWDIWLGWIIACMSLTNSTLLNLYLQIFIFWSWIYLHLLLTILMIILLVITREYNISSFEDVVDGVIWYTCFLVLSA